MFIFAASKAVTNCIAILAIGDLRTSRRRRGSRVLAEFQPGAVFADVDGDGDLDLLVNGLGAGTHLFLNDGKGHFQESTDSGLITKYGSHSLALADVDGDGDLDLYVANYRASTFKDLDVSTTIRLRNINGKLQVPPEYAEQFIVVPSPAGNALVEVGEPDGLYLNNGHGQLRSGLLDQRCFYG